MVSRILLCLFGLVALGASQDETIAKIFECYTDFYVLECPKFDEAVACLENLRGLNMTVNAKAQFNQSLKWFKEELAECPDYFKQGGCIMREMHNCTDAFYEEENKDAKCLLIDSTLTCLGELQSQCNYPWIGQTRGVIERTNIEYCHLVDEERNCIRQADICSNDIRTYPQKYGKFESICNVTATTKDCLEKLRSQPVCNGSELLRSKIGKNIANVEYYENECMLLQGPCSINDIQKCINLFYQSGACSAAAVRETEKCVKELEPKCTLDAKKERLEKETAWMLDYCNYENERNVSTTTSGSGSKWVTDRPNYTTV